MLRLLLRRPSVLPVALAAGLLLAAPAAAQTYTGKLDAGDDRLTSGEYVDWYTVRAAPGQTLVIEMESTSDLDPYLLLRGPDGQDYDNDDAEPGDLVHSRIEFVVLTEGAFQVGATSYEPGETGTYRVAVEVTGLPAGLIDG